MNDLTKYTKTLFNSTTEKDINCATETTREITKFKFKHGETRTNNQIVQITQCAKNWKFSFYRYMMIKIRLTTIILQVVFNRLPAVVAVVEIFPL